MADVEKGTEMGMRQEPVVAAGGTPVAQPYPPAPVAQPYPPAVPAPMVPVAQPMVVAQPNAQVIIVQGENPTVAIVCFILGFFFFFPWFACYCANGGVCSQNKTAKSFNIASLVLLILSLIGIIVAIILTVALFAAFAASTPVCCSGLPPAPPPGQPLIDQSCKDLLLANTAATTDCPSPCDTCGYGDSFYASWECITCKDGYELNVWDGDCTGECVLKDAFDMSTMYPLNTTVSHTSGRTCAFPSGVPQCVKDAMLGVSSGAYTGPPTPVITDTCRTSLLSATQASTDCPADCDTCGYGDSFYLSYECIACKTGFELNVRASDCTGSCVPKNSQWEDSYTSLNTALAKTSSQTCTYAKEVPDCVKDAMIAQSRGVAATTSSTTLAGATNGLLDAACRTNVTTALTTRKTDCRSDRKCDTCDFVYDCLGCESGYELNVRYSDCSGDCVLKTAFSTSTHTPLKNALAGNASTGQSCSWPSNMPTCLRTAMVAASS